MHSSQTDRRGFLVNLLTAVALPAAAALVAGTGCEKHPHHKDPERKNLRPDYLTKSQEKMFREVLSSSEWTRTRDGHNEILSTYHDGKLFTLIRECRPGHCTVYKFNYTGLELPTGEPFTTNDSKRNRIINDHKERFEFTTQIFSAAGARADRFQIANKK